MLVDYSTIYSCRCHQVIERHEKYHTGQLEAWICDTCGKPFVPKHWEERYSTCQGCHYGV